nr:MAG TPA: hypothetical protein [Siphoviridae sp. ctX8T1]
MASTVRIKTDRETANRMKGWRVVRAGRPKRMAHAAALNRAKWVRSFVSFFMMGLPFVLWFGFTFENGGRMLPSPGLPTPGIGVLSSGRLFFGLWGGLAGSNMGSPFSLLRSLAAEKGYNFFLLFRRGMAGHNKSQNGLHVDGTGLQLFQFGFGSFEFIAGFFRGIGLLLVGFLGFGSFFLLDLVIGGFCRLEVLFGNTFQGLARNQAATGKNQILQEERFDLFPVRAGFICGLFTGSFGIFADNEQVSIRAGIQRAGSIHRTTAGTLAKRLEERIHLLTNVRRGSIQFSLIFLFPASRFTAGRHEVGGKVDTTGRAEQAGLGFNNAIGTKIFIRDSGQFVFRVGIVLGKFAKGGQGELVGLAGLGNRILTGGLGSGCLGGCGFGGSVLLFHDFASFRLYSFFLTEW